jgi:quercetin dioxygenase-like cupin family protein
MDVREDIKGVSRFHFAEGAEDEKLHLHISEVGPGQRAHPPHTHPGQEIFYVFEGKGEVVVGVETVTLSSGDAIQVDCTVEHGIANIGESDMRYAVIIARSGS